METSVLVLIDLLIILLICLDHSMRWTLQLFVIFVREKTALKAAAPETGNINKPLGTGNINKTQRMR